MKSINIIWVVMLLSLLFNAANAAEKLTVVFGGKLAPWVLSDTNEGIIIDLLKATMKPLGYEIQPLYLPYARRINAYKTDEVDVVSDMNLNTINEHGLKGYLSDTAYAYENFAFSLHKNNFEFNELKDLKNHSLLSWQDAAIHLGEAYANMANNHSSYSETFDQLVQVKMLFLEKFDVVQMDAHIFDYYRVQIINNRKINAAQQVDRFGLFGASPNGFLFKSEALRNKFNTQLRHLKATGEYQQIFDRYLTLDNANAEQPDKVKAFN
jgi:polar amino acid transport system substrate-binding protein|tara:strand:- start:11582 stop:12382 length:801 start_codon:yes stop_codon:yes gene_type:complete